MYFSLNYSIFAYLSQFFWVLGFWCSSTMERMRVHLVPLLVIVSMVHAAPAFAFFNILDQLKEEFSGMGGSPEEASVHFDDLIDQLSEGDVPQFNDVVMGAWYESYVRKVAQWGIVTGYKDEQGRSLGRFGPGDPVTVAQMLKMALESAKVDETQCGSSPEHPQAQGHWATQYVACGEKKNMRILRTFPNLDRPALRGEVLVIIHDAFGDRIPPLLSTFEDTAGHPYEADIAYDAVLGIISGDTDRWGSSTGTFRPNDQVNRAEAAKIIYEKLKAQVILQGR